MKPRLRRETRLPKHVVHHHGAFFWRDGPAITVILPDAVDPADLEAIASELRTLHAMREQAGRR